MLNLRAENGTSFLNSRNETTDFVVATQWFLEKNLHSPQAQTILSDIFKIPSDEKEISWEEKEILWDGIFKNSHNIARTSRRFFPFKQK